MPKAVSAPLVCRFAPSPTGRMHAGNIFASLASWLLARKTGGRVVLRIEDLDRDRSRQTYIDQVMRDYEMLGLTWDEGPYFQGDRDEVYRAAFDSLKARGYVYPCFCSRADLHAASAPHPGQQMIYAGTCRGLTAEQQEHRAQDLASAGRPGPSYRLRVPDEGSEQDRCSFFDLFQGACTFGLAKDSGDFVIQRADRSFAYQLAVVVDDAEQGVTAVVRGIDLLDSVPRQMYLQELLDLPHPTYAHVPILATSEGRRLAKREKDAALEALLQTYKGPEGILGNIAGLTGITESRAPQSLDEILDAFDPETCLNKWKGLTSILWEP